MKSNVTFLYVIRPPPEDQVWWWKQGQIMDKWVSGSSLESSHQIMYKTTPGTQKTTKKWATSYLGSDRMFDDFKFVVKWP